MTKNRLEAFSDGVMAIIITIMVLELKPPHAAELSALSKLWPIFASYVISFVYVGIYWNNHHHLLHTVHKVSPGIMWANLHLLFWLSLVPFVTAWSGENQFAMFPVAIYGTVLLFCGVAYYVLSQVIIHSHGNDSVLARAIGNDVKGKVSLVSYAIAVPVAFWQPLVSMGVYIFVALVWLVPDKRIEKALAE